MRLRKRDNPDKWTQSAAKASRRPCRSEEVPYGGDMMAAMRAGDRAAIRTIMSAKNAKPIKKLYQTFS